MSINKIRISSISLGAFVMIFISVMPIISLMNLFCCAGIVIGGLAGVFYLDNKSRSMDYMIGFKDAGIIGALSGVVAAIIVSIITLAITIITKENPIDAGIKTFEELGVQLPAEVLNQLQSFSEEYSKYGFSLSIALLNLLSNLVIYPLFGFLGGILAMSIINKKRQKFV
jgi:hypothetical protein